MERSGMKQNSTPKECNIERDAKYKPILKEQNMQECVNKGLRHEEKKFLKKQ